MTIQQKSHHQRSYKLFLTTLAACALSLSSIGCDQSSGGSGADDSSSKNSTTSEKWPGGSLDGWDTGGAVQSFTRREDTLSEVEHGGYAGTEYAEDDYDYGYDEAYPSEPGAHSEAEYAGGEYPEADYDSRGEMDPVVAQESALEGGEIDDNDDLEAFLAYLEGERELYGDEPAIEWLDVSGRQLITVTDMYGVTVPDARLTFWSEEGRVLQFGRTRADGRFAFFPNLFDATGVIEVEAESPYGDSSSISLNRESSELLIQINGERAPVQEINLEVAFIIDATGSMGGEINRLKDTVTNIAERVGQDGVRLRLGAVAYRDRGDEYTTQTFNFTEDVAAFQEVINGLEANGGGDYPEALNEALEEAQRRLSWTQDESLRLTFLITDAPANHYDKQDFTYAQGVLDAQQMGMKIFPIASGGSDGVAEVQLRQIAQHTLAHFIFITEGGGSTHGSEGSDYHVDPAQFDVERLDDLVVRLINEEVEAWRFEIAESPL